MWLENIDKLQTSGFDTNTKITKWPALDPKLTDLSQDLTNQNLTTIVPWLTLNDLEKRRRTNINRFKEEYMAMLVDETDKLYDIQFIRDNLFNNNSNFFMKNDNLVLDKSLWPSFEGEWYIGIDPAYSNDMFAISVFNYDGASYNQYGIYYKKGVDLTYMQDVCQDLVEHFLPLGLKMMSVDGNGLGIQLSNYLHKLFPSHVRAIRGNRIKVQKGQSISIKEFLHTNQLEKQMNRKITYLRDNVQLMHFSGWQQNYEFERVESDIADDMAHGDTTMANAHALLPVNLNNIRQGRMQYGNKIKKEDEEGGEKSESDKFIDRIQGMYGIKL
jgi:hypothetical protein